MNLKQILAASVVGVGLLGFGFWFGNATAGTTDPGSAADPLVSKSYVDQLVAQLAEKTYIDQRVADLAAQTASKSYVDSKTLFQVVNLPQGSTLLGQSGTEIVLRAGRATAIVSKMGGLLDATTGVDLPQGANVERQHLLVIPVGDGRGVLAQSDSILIVKGTYTVQAAGQ